MKLIVRRWFSHLGIQFPVLVEAVLECVHCSTAYYVTW